jgi:hypothetical protein
MGFWNDPAQTTKVRRNYRFLIQSGLSTNEPYWYWAKAVDLPKFSVGENIYQLGNHKYKYPGTAEWEDVNITIVDESQRAKELYNTLIRGGYLPSIGDPDLAAVYEDEVDGIGKLKLSENFQNGANFQIITLTDEGNPLDTWTLINPWIKQANFGELDYSSDELLTIQLTISFDRARYVTGTFE